MAIHTPESETPQPKIDTLTNPVKATPEGTPPTTEKQEKHVATWKKVVASVFGVGFIGSGIGGVAYALGQRNGEAAPAPEPSTSAPVTPGTSPETEPTPGSTSAEQWVPPTSGDYLKNLSEMSEAEIVKACKIPASNPDAQTPLGMANMINYTLLATVNNVYSKDQLDKYRNDNGQLTVDRTNAYVASAGKVAALCQSAFLNDGETRNVPGMTTFVVDANASRETFADNPEVIKTKLYVAYSEVQESSVQLKDGVLTFKRRSSDNYDDNTFMKYYNENYGQFYENDWPGTSTITCKVSTDADGFLQFKQCSIVEDDPTAPQ